MAAAGNAIDITDEIDMILCSLRFSRFLAKFCLASNSCDFLAEIGDEMELNSGNSE